MADGRAATSPPSRDTSCRNGARLSEWAPLTKCSATIGRPVASWVAQSAKPVSSRRYFGSAVRAPQCQNYRSVVSSRILINVGRTRPLAPVPCNTTSFVIVKGKSPSPFDIRDFFSYRADDPHRGGTAKVEPVQCLGPRALRVETPSTNLGPHYRVLF